MRILVVGDTYMRADVFAQAFDSQFERDHDVRYVSLDEERVLNPTTSSDQRIHEFLGTPQQLVEALDDAVEVIVVHGAPVTAEVLDSAPKIQLVCCARGGPVNVDLEAATERGIAVTTTPGKNAAAVAELTVALIITLARRIDQAHAFLSNHGSLQTAFDGKQFLGLNVSGRTLGLVGFGRVSRRVTPIAHALGMRVLAFDPFVDDDEVSSGGAEPCDFVDLLAESDFVSVHARATAENEDLFATDEFALMKKGSFFINTARESLVDEEALAAALSSGHLRAAAVDVLRLSSAKQRNSLLDLENLVATPHIGGATDGTMALGAHMLVEEITRFAAGEPLHWSAEGIPLEQRR
jgi:D-3-phosphoglycerate dehydrogenase